MFIDAAHAANGFGLFGFDITQFLPLVLIMVAFYFFLIRPQQKKSQRHRAMLSSLERGARILTAGGIIGTITKIIDDNELEIEIADNVRVRVLRSTITDQLPNTSKSSTFVSEASTTTSTKKRSSAAKSAGKTRKTSRMQA